MKLSEYGTLPLNSDRGHVTADLCASNTIMLTHTKPRGKPKGLLQVRPCDAIAIGLMLIQAGHRGLAPDAQLSVTVQKWVP